MEARNVAKYPTMHRAALDNKELSSLQSEQWGNPELDSEFCRARTFRILVTMLYSVRVGSLYVLDERRGR